VLTFLRLTPKVVSSKPVDGHFSTSSVKAPCKPQWLLKHHKHAGCGSQLILYVSSLARRYKIIKITNVYNIEYCLQNICELRDGDVGKYIQSKTTIKLKLKFQLDFTAGIL